MALHVSEVQRVFVFEKNGKKIKLNDIGRDKKPEAVMAFYSEMYPELTTAVVEGPETNSKGEYQYRFVTKLGTKG
jgi:PRTRC genetic system protein C